MRALGQKKAETASVSAHRLVYERHEEAHTWREALTMLHEFSKSTQGRKRYSHPTRRLLRNN